MYVNDFSDKQTGIELDDDFPVWSIEQWNNSYSQWKKLADPEASVDSSLPVLDFSFDGGQAQDLSGNGNDGTIVNGLPTFGKNRRGMLFVGSGTQIVVPNNKNLRLRKGMTLQGWVYANSLRQIDKFSFLDREDYEEIEDPRQCVRRDGTSGNTYSAAYSYLQAVRSAFYRYADALELGTETVPAARKDASLLYKSSSRIRIAPRTIEETNVKSSQAYSRRRSLLAEFGIRTSLETDSRLSGIHLAIDELYEIILVDDAPPAYDWREEPVFQTAPSVLAKINSYGLDVDPLTGCPYAIIFVGRKIFKVISQTPIERFRWVFLAATYDGKTLELYVDGERAARTEVNKSTVKEKVPTENLVPDLLGQKVSQSNLIDESDSPLFVGELPFDQGYSEGIIDEIKVFDYPRSAEAIAREYYRARPLATFSFYSGRTDGSAGRKDIGFTAGAASIVCDTHINSQGKSQGKGNCLLLPGFDAAFFFNIHELQERWQTPYPTVAIEPEANSGSITFQAWVNPQKAPSNFPTNTDVGTVPQILFAQGSPPYNPFWLRLDSTGRLVWTVRLHGSEITLIALKPLEAGHWQSIAATYNEFDGIMRLFIGGMPVGAKPTPWLGCPLEIDWAGGFYAGGPTPYCPAIKMDEITLYPFARTREEIARDATYFDDPCGVRQPGLFPSQSPVDGYGGIQDALDQPIQTQPGGLLDCSRAICNDEQWNNWQQGGFVGNFSDVTIDPTGGTGTVPNCSIAKCTPEAYAAWLAHEQEQRNLVSAYQQTSIDCSIARCTEEQSAVYERQIWQQYEAALKQAFDTTPPDQDECGPINCCPAPFAQTASEDAGVTNEESTGDDSDKTSTEETSEDSDEEKPPKSNVTVSTSEVDESGNTFIRGVRWKGGPRDGQRVSGEWTWTVYFEDGSTANYQIMCYEGDCLVSTGNEDDLATGDGGDALPTDDAQVEDSPDDNQSDTSGTGTSPDTGGTADTNNPEVDSILSDTGTGQRLEPTFDPLADAQRSPWDQWPPGTGEFGPGTGQGIGGSGAGGVSGGDGVAPGLLGNRNRGIMSLHDVNEFLTDPGSYGYGTHNMGEGTAYHTPHNFVVPVKFIENGFIQNSVLESLMGEGRFSSPEGSRPESEPSGENSQRKRLREKVNGALGDLSGRGGGDTTSQSLMAVLQIAAARLFPNREPDPEAEQNLETLLDIITGFTPFVNDARDLYELLTGKDMITGQSLQDWERAMALLGLILGSGVAWRKMLEELAETFRYFPFFRNSDEVIAIARAEAEFIESLNLETTIKPRGLTAKQRSKKWGRYQIETNNGKNVEYTAKFKYDLKKDNWFEGGGRFPRHVLQIDGFEKVGGKIFAIEAKYIDPKAKVANSFHNKNLSRAIAQAQKYQRFLLENPSVEAVVYRCNTPELADHFRTKVIGQLSSEMRSKFRVEVVPASFD
ncbi:MAG: hypothetical protein F6K00_11125 [Leptolyngbya sp. SIOISBB]|nr:hypothetical protein [Leptolyngbya sp. SIOISBB]